MSEFAIAIPTYNNPSQFRECMQSIISQTKKNFKVHIFDDASTVKYDCVLSDFSEDITSITTNSKNVGALQNISAAYNRLRDHYSYILVMHEDDLLHPEFMEIVEGTITNKKKIALVISQFEMFSGKYIENKTEKMSSDLHISLFSKEELCEAFFELQPLAFGSVVYNTACYSDMSLDLHKYAEFADRPFLLGGMKEENRAVVLQFPLYRYRSHGESDNRWKKLRAEHVFALIKLYKQILQPKGVMGVKHFKKRATCFIFSAVENLKLAHSFQNYRSYIWQAYSHGYLSLKYMLLRNSMINKSATRLKNIFR